MSIELKNAPLISVITPAFNHESFITDTIDSIINQDYLNIEYIIINDGSTDNTNELILSKEKECISRFHKYKYINNNHKGLIKTLNEGIRASCGEYIYLIASDDIAESSALKELYICMKEYPDFALVVGDNSFIDENGKKCFWANNHQVEYNLKKAKYKTFGEFLRTIRLDVNFNSSDFGSYSSLLKGNYIPNGYLIRRKSIEKIGFFSEKALLEDYHLMLQLSKEYKMKYVDKELFNYRWHSNNSIKNRKLQVYNYRKTLNLEKKYCIQKGYYKIWRLSILKTYIQTFKYMILDIPLIGSILKKLYNN